jgi:hypothetical protein
MFIIHIFNIQINDDDNKVGAVCNNAEIINSQLRGQPTEGALLAVAMKVIIVFKKQRNECFFSHR